MKHEYAVHYDEMIKLLRAGTPFAFAKYGDGEFKAMFHWKGCNTDKHIYFPEMGDRLKAILTSAPPYMIGVQSLSSKLFKEDPRFAKLAAFGNRPNETLHHANISGDRLHAFFAALRGKSVVLVGPDYLERIADVRPNFSFDHVQIPRRQCWKVTDHILRELFKRLNQRTIFLFAAGMPSKIWIHELWEKDSGSTYIDVGSALDPHAGHYSRTYHRALTWVGKDHHRRTGKQ